MGVTHDWYWRGYRIGKTEYADETLIDRERMLKAELHTATRRTHRAFALGELRGYRDRIRVVGKHGRPGPAVVVGGDPVTGAMIYGPSREPDENYIDQWKAERVRQLREEQAEAMRASDAGAWEER